MESQFKSHPIKEKEEYVRNLYFDMLCVIAQYECNDTENAFNMIKSMISSCDEVLLFEEYIKHSMKFTTDRVTEFVKQCKDNHLCELFYVDVVLLVCAGGVANRKKISLIAQLSDIFGFDKEKNIFLTRLIKSILEQNDTFYRMAYLEYENPNVPRILRSIKCYSDKYASVPDYWCKSSEVMDKDNPIGAEWGYYGDSDVCIFNNQYFTKEEKEAYSPVYIKNNKKLVIRNCKFYNCKLDIENCHDILIENCEFVTDLQCCSTPLEIECYKPTNPNIKIINCTFDGYRDEMARYYSPPSNCIEFKFSIADTVANVYLKKCRFVNISVN